jgi:hypothetical protein
MQTSPALIFSHSVSIMRDDSDPGISVCGQKGRDGGTANEGRKAMSKGCVAVMSIRRPTHRNGGSCSGEGHRRELALQQQSVASPVRAAGPSPPSRRSLGATTFPLVTAGSPGAGIRGQAPLGIGVVVNRRSVCDRRGFAGGSGCAQGGPLRVPCSHWLGAVSLGTWRRRRPGLLPAVLGATGNR